MKETIKFSFMALHILDKMLQLFFTADKVNTHFQCNNIISGLYMRRNREKNGILIRKKKSMSDQSSGKKKKNMLR
jgi:hypothetical protein